MSLRRTLAMQFALFVAVVLPGAGASSEPKCHAPVDFHPLGPHEEFLRPYVDKIVDYRKNPIARRYLTLAKIVDVLPTWLEDMFVPLVLPGSKMTIPVGMSIPVPILNKNVTVDSITVTHLNKFTELKPLALLDDSRYTFRTIIALKEATILLHLKGVPLPLPIPLPKNFGFDLTYTLAFDRYRMCKVWGATMRSGVPCAVAPIFHDPVTNATGLKVHAMTLKLFGVPVPLLGDVVGSLNDKIASWLPEMQKSQPCPVSTSPITNAGLANVPNVSRVCIVNNAGFVVKFQFTNCVNCAASGFGRGVPIDQKVCMDASSVAGVEGEEMRVVANAVAGVLNIVDPAVRFSPGSGMVAALECSGSTLLYGCELISYAPMAPLALPKVSTVCVVNQAGFVMDFQVIKVGMPWVKQGSDTYPINQKRCISLDKTWFAKEGDIFKVVIKAHGGKTIVANRRIRYTKNIFPAGYVCKGSTMRYKCNIVTSSFLDDSDDASENETMVIV